MFFAFDFYLLYNNSNPNSKYFLPVLITKIIFTVVMLVSLSNYFFEMMLMITLTNLFFIWFLLKVRPFKSAFSNMRIIVIEIVLLLINAVYAVYQFYASGNIYVQIL